MQLRSYISGIFKSHGIFEVKFHITDTRMTYAYKRKQHSLYCMLLLVWEPSILLITLHAIMTAVWRKEKGQITIKRLLVLQSLYKRIVKRITREHQRKSKPNVQKGVLVKSCPTPTHYSQRQSFQWGRIEPPQAIPVYAAVYDCCH